MDALRRIGTVLAFAGGITFIAVLYFSAYFEPDIRWLHFFQSWMYIAALVLISRRSKWGCFIGATAAFFWDYVNVFVTTFFRNGIDQLHILSRTGQVPRPESLISVPAWFGNFAVILGALLVYIALPRKQWSDVGRVSRPRWNTGVLRGGNGACSTSLPTVLPSCAPSALEALEVPLS